ncbi:MAG: macro domain-containing protein [Chloroflexota bacterium]
MTRSIEIDIWHGAIADLEVDAIILPANESLFMTGPVGAAVKRRAGDSVERAAVAQGPVAAGSAVVTPGGALATPWLIHAVAVGHELRHDAASLDAALDAALAAAGALAAGRVAIAPLGVERGVFSPSEAAEALARALRDRDVAPATMRSMVVAVTSAAEAHAFNAALEGVRARA